MKTLGTCLAASLLALVAATLTSHASDQTLEDAAQLLASGHAESPAALEARLRAAGPDGLAAMAKVRDELAKKAAVGNRPVKPPHVVEAAKERLARFDAAMDRVGGAKYCSRSRLYWHTDFEAARAAAQESGKPILSLRLLGNLTDNYSCANSRFFRTTLYANEEVAKLLRDNFVLHWKSVRPVPIVTIDFGDGRTLRRTLTGNSIHYVLTPEGNVVDALPGLYGPKAFQTQLNEALPAARQMAGMNSAQWSEALADYHREKLERLNAAWAQDLASIDATSKQALLARAQSAPLPPVSAKGSANPPPAAAAARIAVPKARVEMPLIAEVVPPSREPNAVDDEKTWAAIAALHAEDAQLDGASRALIESEKPTAAQANRLSFTKAAVESPLVAMFRSLQGAIALDTVRNEYQLHRAIHQWLAEASYRPGVDALNERVYAELFLTPRTDPWLGLAPADAYTALPNGGVVGASVTRAR